MRVKKTPTGPLDTLTPGLRRYLYFTASITGASVMIVQILGARMLAPYVGTSHFVWTAQIAVTLVALACGYYLGGTLADRSPKLGRLYACIIAAAAFLCGTLAAVEPVAYWCLRYKLVIGSLLASAFLFFIPLLLLAMVGPFFVRVMTSNVQGVGSNVGRLSAISTFGSFAGTLLIGYVLVPLLPNSMTMYLTCALLTVISLIYFIIWQRAAVPPVATAITLTLFIGFVSARYSSLSRFERFEELTRENSYFGELQVLQERERTRRLYLNDFLTQNTYDIATGQSMSMFTYMLHGLAHAYTPKLETALCIGMGVGIVPMDFVREGVKTDVVEINPAVVPLAKKYFGCEPEKFGLSIGDGRYFVNQSTQRYDTIILDAFLGDSSPAHLMTREAFTAMQRCLNTNGTLVINAFGDFAHDRDFFMTSLDKTLRSVFKSVLIHHAGNGNVFFVASPQGELKLAKEPDYRAVHPYARELVRAAFGRVTTVDAARGIVLTDDFNPVDFHDAPNRETQRRRLAESIRTL